MKAQNKAITESTSKDTALEEFHFAGSGKYKPVTISARDIHEATKKYEQVKVEVEK